MDIQNHFYGHSAVLAGYAGLRAPRHMAGLYQHGWTPLTPLRTHFADLAARTPAGGLFTWSHDSRGWTEAESRAETGFSTTPIGAAALYFLRMVEGARARPEPSIDAVVFPFHGTRLVSVEGDHAGFAREVYEREGPSLVCLHVDDLQKPELVDLWRNAGHTLTTAGERRDPRFLARVMWLVMNARKVISNRLATSLLYAAAAETPARIYGPHFQIAGIEETSSEEYLKALWPEFYEEEPDVAHLHEVAGQELGARYVRSPDELRQILGWQSRRLRPAIEYWVGSPLAKAEAVLGLRDRQVGPLLNEVKVSPFQFFRNPLEHLPGTLPRAVSTTLVAPEFTVLV